MSENLDEVYNKFFYATVCHVCKRYGVRVVLRKCSGCKLISYCSKDHQKLHWPQHKNLCKTVKYVRETCPSEFFPTEEKNAMMTQLKLLKTKVTFRLKRKLLPYEVQMLKYPKMCVVCQKQDTQLEDCSTCMSVSFCKNHIHVKKHDKLNCDLLKMAFQAYMYTFSSVSEPVCVNYMPQISERKTFSDMKEFLNVYGDIIKSTLKLPISNKLFEIEQSTYFTKPLTIIQGMQILKYSPQKKSLVFHVIVRNTTNMQCLPCWEIILHLVPNIKSLKVILIGPDQTSFNHNLELCTRCRQHKKKISIKCLDKLFEAYVEETAFEKPDLIIGFHPSFSRCVIESEDTIANEANKWVPSIQTLAKQKCPLILTCYSNHDVKLEILNINLTLKKNIHYLYCEKNPFGGRRGRRESDDELQFPLYFENHYLLVYKNLYNIK